MKLSPIEDLINQQEPGWALVQDWIASATNAVEVLENDPASARKALYQTQVTTRSPMGSIIYESGGILVDHGWIRILGAGSDLMKRSLPEWNRGKTFEQIEEGISYLLIADDAIGGFFALNGGALGDDRGMTYYLAPDTLDWEALSLTYSQFIRWSFHGDLEHFYEELRWENWQAEVREMGPDRVMNYYPFLWVKIDDFTKRQRKSVPIQEAWQLHMDIRKQLSGEDH